MPNIKLIIKELKKHLSIKKDNDFASFLGVTPTALANWKKRDSIDYELVYTKCEFVDANWLLTGKGEMLRKKPTTYEIEPPKISKVTEPIFSYDSSDAVRIPIIDINVAAGIGSINDDHPELLGEITIPSHMVKRNRVHAVVRITGESMAPTLLDSSYLVIRLLDKSEWRDMPNDHVYVVGDREGIGRVKRVRNRWEKGFIVLTSDNIDKNAYRNYNLHDYEVNTIWHAEWYFSARMDNINKTYYNDLNEVKNRLDDIEEILGQKTLKEFNPNK